MVRRSATGLELVLHKGWTHTLHRPIHTDTRMIAASARSSAGSCWAIAVRKGTMPLVVVAGRAALALAMAAVAACTLLGRHALTKAALQVAASAAQVELSLDEVRLSLFPLTLTCTDLSAQTLDGQHRWHLDRLKAGPASIADGSCNVQQLTLGHLHWDVFEATTHNDSTSSLPFDMTSTWKGIWASLPWSSLHLGELTWDSLSWAGTSGAKVRVDAGLWTDWNANPTGLLVENGTWGSGAWTAHEGAEPWTWSPGQVRAKWDMDGWDLESPGFDLPGLQWEGRLTWPLQPSQGKR